MYVREAKTSETPAIEKLLFNRGRFAYYGKASNAGGLQMPVLRL